MLFLLLNTPQNLDETINEQFKNATGWFIDGIFAEIPLTPNVGIPWVLIVLILGALYFTIYFRFVNIKEFFTAIKVVRGDYEHLENPTSDENIVRIEEDRSKPSKVEGDGEVSHFQALTAAISATVGLGNIAGVAIALGIGGPGATFWMILIGLLGMSSKFVECTLGVKYREVNAEGTIFGGPMYYLRKGLEEKGLQKLGKILAIIFSIMCIGGSFGGGNMFQVNQAFKLFEHVTGGSESILYERGWIFGLIMAICVGIVIIGGIRKIARVTDKIVPFMVVMYILAVLIILGMNYQLIPDAFRSIWDGAFNPQGIIGGFIGVLIQGFKRAAFSNEAGIGSASIAHSAVKTKYPASEGLVALLEPFIDTVVVCTMTALVLIITNVITPNMTLNDEEGVLLTAQALESGISWFPYLLSFAVILFAFSSMISWSYYGYQAWSYLFGRGKRTEYTYKLLFCVFTVIGAAATLGAVTDFSDAMIFSMLVPNMIGLFILSPKVAEELKRYRKLIKSKA
ncbi:alanine/glycine:cation symporter family protein [Christiangramia forsetii]|uniref:Sodium:alanine symporter family protein n=2 Tax=Christiangramia forsetii TaxID=411153 RepID=A0M4S2_CHRFK|nr:alanine/glycine:cation symporter family protein [Christiangramia forsetii]GGG22804.1 alanine glycine permease [Christiangramia forsetii]CAL67617.1 sodium:alanine symporter family protein [Christiangramia forsetii KT0803]